MSQSTSSGGIGFSGILTIMFIMLKLIGIITWSWWWVLAPVWLPIIGLIAVLLFLAIAAAIMDVLR